MLLEARRYRLIATFCSIPLGDDHSVGVADSLIVVGCNVANGGRVLVFLYNVRGKNGIVGCFLVRAFQCTRVYRLDMYLPLMTVRSLNLNGSHLTLTNGN